MTLPAVVVRLEPEEVLELQRVLLDEDEAGALRLLETVLFPKVNERLSRGHCRPTFEWGGRDMARTEPPR